MVRKDLEALECEQEPKEIGSPAKELERTRPLPFQAGEKYSAWDEEAGTLAKWIEGIKESDLPPAPFELAPGVTVTNSGLFLAAIKQAIARGPGDARARTGALQEDFKRIARILGWGQA